MARFDIHRPAAIIPEDYEFIAFDYLPSDGDILGNAMFLAAERARKVAHMKMTGGRYSGHEHGGNCHICGSVNAIYTATFFHSGTNTYIKTGLDCAEKLECGGVEDFRKKVTTALEASKGKRKAKAVLDEAGKGAAWAVYEKDGPSTSDEAVVKDIVGKLIKYGSVSDKAMSYMGALLDRIAKAPEIAAKRAAEAAAAKPVPVVAGRMVVRGKVATIKTVEGHYGVTVKMLVIHEDGWKVWSTVPSGIRDGLTRGDEIEFDAEVTASDDDPKFGFASRPSKAKVLKEAEVA